MELMLSSELLKFARFSHVRSDVMLCARAFNMASKMTDVPIVLGWKGHILKQTDLITTYHALL